MYSDDGDIESRLADILDRILTLETQAPIGYSSVTKGSLRIASPEGLIVEGSARVDGTLAGSGTFSWTGPWELLGNGEVAGNVGWSGDLNLTGNITVTGTGRITAGGIVIDPSTAGGQINFGSNRRIDAGSGFLGIYDGSRFVVFNSSGVTLNGGSGSPTVTVGPTGLTISGLPSIESWAANGAVEGTLWQDTAGKVYRVIP